MMISEKKTKQSPIIWLLLEHNYIGANKQCITLANHLGLGYECKMLVFNKDVILSRSEFLAGSLKQLQQEQSASLLSPWPDLILVSTRACEQVALWIKKTSHSKTKIVRLGKIRTPTDLWDLIISSKQYFLPKRNNILRTNLPLRDLNSDLMQFDILQWQAQINHLPGPYFSLFLGGPVKSFPYTEDRAKKLAELLNKKFRGQGTLLISSSRRTPQDFFTSLINNLQLPYYSYSWAANNLGNPYFAFLGIAKEVIIAGDSITMLAEAVIAGKFIHIYYHRRSWFYSLGMYLAKRLVSLLGIFTTKLLIVFRDDRRIHQYLIANGWAEMLQVEKNKPAIARAVINDDLQKAVMRVRQLFVEPCPG